MGVKANYCTRRHIRWSQIVGALPSLKMGETAVWYRSASDTSFDEKVLCEDEEGDRVMPLVSLNFQMMRPSRARDGRGGERGS